MARYKLILCYDGTNYGGWQKQNNTLTIQQLLEEKLSILLRKDIDVIGSGRTDAGVHALAQVAHFTYDEEILPHKICYGLNCLLPKDIRVLSLEEVDPDFHARFSATRKIYHYHLHTDPIANPFKRKYSFHVRHHLDLDKMKEGANLLIGTHDFSSFANERGDKEKEKDNTRTIYRIDIAQEEGGYRLEFEGSGFLYKMVRNITGTLLEIGGGKRCPKEIHNILCSKDRKKAGKAADACGLFLVEVIYEEAKSSSKEEMILAPFALSSIS